MEGDMSKMDLDFDFSTEVVCLWPWDYHHYEPPGCQNHTHMYHCSSVERCESCLSRASEATWIPLPTIPIPLPISILTSTSPSLITTNLNHDKKHKPDQDKMESQDQDLHQHSHLRFNLQEEPACADHIPTAITPTPVTSKCRVYPNDNQPCLICSESTDKLLSIIRWVQEGEWLANSSSECHRHAAVSSSTSTSSPEHEQGSEQDQLSSDENEINIINNGLDSMSSTDGLDQEAGHIIYERSLPVAWNSESCESYASPEPETSDTLQAEVVETLGSLLSDWKPFPLFGNASRQFSEETQDTHEFDRYSRRSKSKASLNNGYGRSNRNQSPRNCPYISTSASAHAKLTTAACTPNLFYSNDNNCDANDDNKHEQDQDIDIIDIGVIDVKVKVIKDTLPLSTAKLPGSTEDENQQLDKDQFQGVLETNTNPTGNDGAGPGSSPFRWTQTRDLDDDIPGFNFRSIQNKNSSAAQFSQLQLENLDLEISSSLNAPDSTDKEVGLLPLNLDAERQDELTAAYNENGGSGNQDQESYSLIPVNPVPSICQEKLSVTDTEKIINISCQAQGQPKNKKGRKKKLEKQKNLMKVEKNPVSIENRSGLTLTLSSTETEASVAVNLKSVGSETKCQSQIKVSIDQGLSTVSSTGRPKNQNQSKPGPGTSNNSFKGLLSPTPRSPFYSIIQRKDFGFDIRNNPRLVRLQALQSCRQNLEIASNPCSCRSALGISNEPNNCSSISNNSNSKNYNDRNERQRPDAQFSRVENDQSWNIESNADSTNEERGRNKLKWDSCSISTKEKRKVRRIKRNQTVPEPEQEETTYCSLYHKNDLMKHAGTQTKKF